MKLIQHSLGLGLLSSFSMIIKLSSSSSHADSTKFPDSLSCHTSLSSIAPGRSFRLHLVFAQSWCKSVLSGWSTLTCPCAGVHKKMFLMSSSLLLQQCPACLVCLTWVVCKMGGKWPYSFCFVGRCFQDFFRTMCSTLV